MAELIFVRPSLSVMTHPMQLVPPSLDRLPSYVAALKRGWSPDNMRGASASIEELAQIEKDPRSFVESLTDREGKGAPIVLPDGSSAARLPGFRLWLWLRPGLELCFGSGFIDCDFGLDFGLGLALGYALRAGL